MLELKLTGSNKTERWLEKLQKNIIPEANLAKYGELGVQALAANTPKDTGQTAGSWYYTIEKSKDSVTISWENRNVHNGVVIAAILQYGHGTGTGGYVRGIDYINPSMKPVFQQIADDAWREVNMK